MFSWVSTHIAIAQKLTTYENRQPELIALLKHCGETLLNDIDVDGSEIQLNEIDPFTFFFYLYKYGAAKRIERLRCVAQNFDISPLPDDTDGLPSANAQKVRLFPNKKDRNDSEIVRLWHFFKAAMNEQLNNDLFLDILTINGVGKTKITESLFVTIQQKKMHLMSFFT
jgi:5-methylcytosine-specific restriction protein B